MVGNFLVLGSVSEWKHAGMKLLKLLSQWLEELLRINFRKLRQTIEADPCGKQGTHSQPSLFVVLRDFGSWAHLCWLCPQSPLISHRLLPLPSTLLIRSLGWTSGGQEVLMYMYMAMIQKVLWHEQHGRA